MYHTCIFCSAYLKSNDALERFPIGRSIAFDGEKGRLWAVCPKCARWNLAPLEERWEAIEEAERLFHDTRTRVQRENVGLAKLRDGTRLIRIGRALTGELAAWRYGGQLTSRRRRYLWAAGAAGVLTAGWALGASAVLGTGFATVMLAQDALNRVFRTPAVVHVFPRGTMLPVAVQVHARDLRRARLVTLDGGGVGLEITKSAGALDRFDHGGGIRRTGATLHVAPEDTRMLLRRGLVHVNASGAGRGLVDRAVRLLEKSGSAEQYLRDSAGRRARVAATALHASDGRPHALALEMAVHDELERQALEGELAALAEMWRQAEEIAAIADRLPDVPAPEPPRTGISAR